MKKILLALLAILLSFSMFSCTLFGGEEEDEKPDDEGTSEDSKIPFDPFDTPMGDLPL
ncbi:MAG: hypothetical protein IKC32_03815 [Clostridia bacterium]|nr:hypothetical protein [Clostridia bacterium]